MEHFNLPISKLTEEALEVRHKETRKIRLCYTSKSSRTDTNKDLINMLITSDPELSSLRLTTSSKGPELNTQIEAYLMHNETTSSTYPVKLPEGLVVTEAEGEESESE